MKLPGIKFSGIAFRLGAAMMFAALLSIILVFVTIVLTAEQRVRTPPPEVSEVRAFFSNAAKLCRERPDILPNCPSFVTDERPDPRGALLIPAAVATNNAAANQNANATSAPNPDSSAASSTTPSSNAQSSNAAPSSQANPQDPNAQPRRGRGARVDIFDPRPWVLPALIASTIFAALLALVSALFLGRRIAHPIQSVSKAAQLVAGGQLSARVGVPKRPNPADETAQLALSFNRMAQTLEENELERRQLIADIAHELRTPLAVMASRLEALEDGVFELNASEVARLQTQTKFLSRLVEDLRVLSLAEAGRLSLERRGVNLDALAAETAHTFASRAEQAGKRIALDVPHEPLPVNADPDRLRQVLTNLLENALKYAQHEVTMRLETQGGWVNLTVSDDGQGLSPGEETQVFNRFYRADESRNRATGGSGLGLSIVKAITELHGGSVWARNLDTGGAVFTVRLPLERPSQPKPKLVEARV